MVGERGDTADGGMVVTTQERREQRERELIERDEQYGLNGKNPDVPFEGIKYVAMLDPKQIKFTRTGDMMIGFVIPARYVDNMIQLRAAMRVPLLLDIQPWKPS
jgi:hypothetical protein